jgi:hypothetical protein
MIIKDIPDVYKIARVYKLEQKLKVRKIAKYEFKELWELLGFSNEFTEDSWKVYKKKLKVNGRAGKL